MPARTYKSGEISALGEAIFRDQIENRVKSARVGDFVVIDIETGDYEVAPGDAIATRRLLKRSPEAVTYGVRVGHRAAYSHSGGFRNHDIHLSLDGRGRREAAGESLPRVSRRGEARGLKTVDRSR